MWAGFCSSRFCKHRSLRTRIHSFGRALLRHLCILSQIANDEITNSLNGSELNRSPDLFELNGSCVHSFGTPYPRGLYSSPVSCPASRLEDRHSPGKEHRPMAATTPIQEADLEFDHGSFRFSRICRAGTLPTGSRWPRSSTTHCSSPTPRATRLRTSATRPSATALPAPW